MDALRYDVLSLVELCRRAVVMPKRLRSVVDAATLASVGETLEKVRREIPDDTALFNVTMETHTSWWGVLFALEVANRALEREAVKRHWRMNERRNAGR